MSCQEFEFVSVELARGSLLDAAARESALAHAQGCATCAARLRRERALTSALREVGASMREREAPARVEAALLSALRERRQGAPVVESPAPAGSVSALFTPRLRRAFYATAIAASLLLVALVVWRALNRHETPGQHVETADGERRANDSATVANGSNSMQSVEVTRATKSEDQTAKIEDTAATGHAPEEVAVKSKTTTRYSPDAQTSARRGSSAFGEALPISFRVDGGRVTAPRLSGAQGGDAAEVALSDFMPLGAAGHAAPLDSGEIVRVEVPRAALAALGLPVNASRATETVKADLLLAHDGTARAIRLVQ